MSIVGGDGFHEHDDAGLGRAIRRASLKSNNATDGCGADYRPAARLDDVWNRILRVEEGNGQRGSNREIPHRIVGIGYRGGFFQVSGIVKQNCDGAEALAYPLDHGPDSVCLGTSQGRYEASPPAASIASTVSCPAESLISVTATVAPSRANIRLVSHPMPDATPLMIATFPESRIPFNSPSLTSHRKDESVRLCAVWNRRAATPVCVSERRVSRAGRSDLAVEVGACIIRSAGVA